MQDCVVGNCHRDTVSHIPTTRTTQVQWKQAQHPNASVVPAKTYLSTQGSKIIDGHGKEFVIAGVNWYGAEEDRFVPGGLEQRSYKDVLNEIVQHGYNTVRFPYCNDALRDGYPRKINYGLNPEFQGKSVLQVWDLIFDYAGSLGLKIILDRHRPDPVAQSPLWYTNSVSEEKWIQDWKFLANRYLNNPTIIGADLHNEPRAQACWGCGDPKTDWRAAAERCGNAIHTVNPNWLIFVEGIHWGTDIKDAGEKQVLLTVPNKLVYSMHDYGITVAQVQPRFIDPNFPYNMPEFYDVAFGYLIENNTAPVFIGEFGTKLQDPIDKKWIGALVEYIKKSGASWAYWCWNPESSDTGGIVQDDWRTYRYELDDYLHTIKHPIPTSTLFSARYSAKNTTKTRIPRLYGNSTNII